MSKIRLVIQYLSFSLVLGLMGTAFAFEQESRVECTAVCVKSFNEATMRQGEFKMVKSSFQKSISVTEIGDRLAVYKKLKAQCLNEKFEMELQEHLDVNPYMDNNKSNFNLTGPAYLKSFGDDSSNPIKNCVYVPVKD